MLDLDTADVLDWFTRAEPDLAATLGQPRWPAEEAEDLRRALVRVGELLDQARTQDAAGLAAALCSAPLRDALAAFLTRLRPVHQLRLFDWLAEPCPAGRDPVLEVLLADDDSSDEPGLQWTLYALYRRVLLARLFAPERLAVLKEACRTAEGD